MKLNRLKDFNTSIFERFNATEGYTLAGAGLNLLICVLEILIVIAFVPLVFETNDDVIMNAIAAGATTGSHSEYLMFSNIAIGQFLTWCYSHFPEVNWYTWYLIVAFALGYGAIQHVYFQLQGSNWMRIFGHILIFSLVIHALFVLQFTRIAAVVASGGFLLVLLNQRRSLSTFLLGAALVVSASAIRFPVFLMFIAISFPFLLFILLNRQWRPLIWLSLAFAGAFALNAYHNHAYKANPEMAEYMAFNIIRSGVTTNDSPQFNYQNKKQVADSLGWSKNDFMLISNFNLDVGIEKFGIDKLEKALAYDPTESADKSYVKLTVHTLKATLVKFAKFLFSPQHSAMLLLFLFVLIGQWKLAGRIALGFFAYTIFVGFSVALFANGHLKPWVLFGMTLPFFFLLIFSFRPILLFEKFNRIFPRKLLYRNTLIFFAAVFTYIPVALHVSIMPSAIESRIERDKLVYQAIESFNDPFYAGWTSITHYNLFEQPYEKSNAYGMGWRAGSPWNKQLIEKYTKQKDLGVFSIRNKPIVWYFRKADDLFFQNYDQLILKFYEENYPTCHIEHQVIPVTERDTLYRYTFFIDS